MKTVNLCDYSLVCPDCTVVLRFHKEPEQAFKDGDERIYFQHPEWPFQGKCKSKKAKQYSIATSDLFRSLPVRKERKN